MWLNRGQMAELFDRDVKMIGKHIENARRDRDIKSAGYVFVFRERIGRKEKNPVG